jgi:tetratricopeptide (TPR) repeat protein
VLKRVGNALYVSQRFTQAAALYARAAEIDPGNAAVHCNMSAALFECVRARVGRTGVAGYRRGVVRMSRRQQQPPPEQLRLAAAAATRAIELDPQYTKARPSLAPPPPDPLCLTGLAQAYLRRGEVRLLQRDLLGSVADFRRALQLKPDAPELAHLLSVRAASCAVV